ncbi:MAG: cellulase family glycosylhydrolase [Chitinophagales bacterium]
MKRQEIISSVMLAVLIFILGCKKGDTPNHSYLDSNVFQDSYGRTLIFHGASLYTNDEPGGYIRYNSNGAKRLINDWGLNSVRMFWNWNALEPDSAVFSADKLETIVRVVENFTNEGVYVVLAVNGTATSSQHLITGTWQAPAGGATNNPALPGALNPAVQESMRRFWDYKNYAYLQDEFIKASKYLALRLKNNPYVLGYDIINEPWGDGLISTVLNVNLETQLLPGLYQRYIEAMRETENDKYLFFEPSVLFNIKEVANFQTKLPVINDTRMGVKHLAFAPHCYLADERTNTIKNSYDSYLGMLKKNYTAIQQKQQVPVYIGEWANIDYTKFVDWENYLHQHMAAFDDIKASWSYFSYIPGENNLVKGDDVTENPTANTIARVYPRATSGELLSFSYQPDAKVFRMSFINDASISQPTEIFIPKRHYPNGYNLSVTGTTDYTAEFDTMKNILKLKVNENKEISIGITAK